MRSAGEVFGLVLIVVGVIVLLGTVGADAGLAASLQWLWPLLIVGLGLWLLWEAGNRRRSRPPAGWSSWGTTPPPSAPGTPPPPADAWSPDAAPSGAWPPGPDATPEADASGPGPAWPTSGSWGAGTSGWRAGTSGTAGTAGWGTGAGAWGPGAFQDRRFLGEIEVAGPMQAGPMRIETVIGEIRVDLTQATFPEGETPIHVSAAIGEVRVLLPADIPASVRATSMLGESEALGRVSGAFMGDVRAETDDYAAATKRIRLEAQSLIGEVAVRRARPAGGPDLARPPAAPVAADPYAPAPADSSAADRLAPPPADSSAADRLAPPPADSSAADPYAPAATGRPVWTPPLAPGAPVAPDEPATPEAPGATDQPPAGPSA
jgi:lia operon protein LiaF